MEAGIYQHYKGDHYLVLGIAQHTEEDEQLVIYVSLSDPVGKGVRLRARPLHTTDGKGWLDPVAGRSRFLFIGQEVTGETRLDGGE